MSDIDKIEGERIISIIHKTISLYEDEDGNILLSEFSDIEFFKKEMLKILLDEKEYRMLCGNREINNRHKPKEDK